MPVPGQVPGQRPQHAQHPQHPLPQRRYLTLSAQTSPAEIRSARFEDNDYIVVPVIALVGNTILHPLNSTGAEFVPAEELAAAPMGWNGRPVLPDHPANGRGSANDPATLESMRFGYMFNTRFENNRLKTEAWLDPARAEKVGSSAARVIERCRAGEMVEVSVGVWVNSEPRPGTYKGQKYDFIWSGPVPDHLAMLPEGVTGACSVEMGCGGPRAAKACDRQSQSANGGSVSMKDKSLIRRILDNLGIKSAQAVGEDGVSDVDLRNSLFDALRAVEPGFDWISEVFPDTSTVIYTTFPENEVLWFRRTYTLAEDGSVTLNDDRERVEPVTEWRPVAAEMGAAEHVTEPTIKANCACDQHNESTGHPAQGDNSPMDKKTLIGRLIGCAAAPFVEKDRTTLSTFDLPTLQSLADKYDPATGKTADDLSKSKGGTTGTTDTSRPGHPTSGDPASPAVVVETPATPPDPNTPAEKARNDQQTADDANAADTRNAADARPSASPSPTVTVPADKWAAVTRLADREIQREAAHRTSLISSLSAANRTLSADWLKTQPTDVLEVMADALQVNSPTSAAIDYSASRSLSSGTDPDTDVYTPPDPWGLNIAALQMRPVQAPKAAN